MLLPLPSAIIQEQALPPLPFDRCAWEKEVTEAFKTSHRVQQNHVLQLFRDQPRFNCLIRLLILGEDQPKYFLYQRGQAITPIAGNLVTVRNQAIIEFGHIGYVFEGGFTVFTRF